MGEPGAICFYTEDGNFYHLNYVFDDVKLDKVKKYFPVLKECDFGMFGLDSSVPEGWNYYNLGMGNHLIVNSCVNDRFSELLGDEEEPSVTYGRWREIAETLLLK